MIISYSRITEVCQKQRKMERTLRLSKTIVQWGGGEGSAQ